MLRQLLVSAILVAVASTCAQRQTPATEAQPTTSFAPETSETTVKDIPTTAAASEPTSTKGPPTTAAVTDAPPTTTKNTPTTETSNNPLPTTTAPLPTTPTTTMTTTERTTTDPEPPRTCAKNGDIKAIFLLVDGSGTFKQFWSNVLPFMRLFKEHVSRHIPIWFYQWSSPNEHCEWNGQIRRNQSWGCYDDYDPCQNYDLSYWNCPAEQFLPLPADWTEKDFDTTIERIYTLNQDGWTRPWHYINHAINEWKVAKKNMTLGKNDRALLVQITDGQSPTGIDWDVVNAFNEENMKFFGVRVYSKGLDMKPYYPIVKDTSKDIITVYNPATELNGDLVKKIVTGGCTPEATPYR